MTSNVSIIMILFLLTIGSINQLKAQNRNFMVNLSIGAGNSGFNTAEPLDDKIKSIYYPIAGVQIQKRIHSKWALNVFPNVGMSGNKRIFSNPVGNVTEVRSTSAFVNLALHPKYYINDVLYLSLGPEVSCLLWNRGSTYNGSERQTRINETRFFNRIGILASSSIGISKKIETSRKNAPIQIDALGYLEFRLKKGLTNILNRDFFSDELSSTILSFEIVVGFSFSSQN